MSRADSDREEGELDTDSDVELAESVHQPKPHDQQAGMAVAEPEAEQAEGIHHGWPASAPMRGGGGSSHRSVKPVMSDSDSDDPSAIFKHNQRPPAPAPKPPAGGPQRKRSNNVWGNVLIEQSLSSSLGGVTNHLNAGELFTVERGTESYSLRKDYDEGEESPPEEAPQHDMKSKKASEVPSVTALDDKESFGTSGEGTKVSVKQRLGKRTRRRSSSGGSGNMSADDGPSHAKRRHGNRPAPTEGESEEEQDVVQMIAEELGEERTDLIARAVRLLGIEAVREFYNKTLDIETTGGMFTMDGSRRRSPGGVFFRLIRESDTIAKRIINDIFFEDKRAIKKATRAKKRRYEARKKQLQRSNSDGAKAPNNSPSPSVSPNGSGDEEVDMNDGAALITPLENEIELIG